MLDELSMRCTKLDLPTIQSAIEKGRSLFSNHMVTCSVRQAATESDD